MCGVVLTSRIDIPYVVSLYLYIHCVLWVGLLLYAYLHLADSFTSHYIHLLSGSTLSKKENISELLHPAPLSRFNNIRNNVSPKNKVICLRDYNCYFRFNHCFIGEYFYNFLKYKHLEHILVSLY